MITFSCKEKGLVDNRACYECYNSQEDKKLAATRVLCKRENVLEEIHDSGIVSEVSKVSEVSEPGKPELEKA
jgi:hypothetical protein